MKVPAGAEGEEEEEETKYELQGFTEPEDGSKGETDLEEVAGGEGGDYVGGKQPKRWSKAEDRPKAAPAAGLGTAATLRNMLQQQGTASVAAHQASLEPPAKAEPELKTEPAKASIKKNPLKGMFDRPAAVSV